MARVTIEDCLENVDNRFELVLVASKRARQLAMGKEPLIAAENDKPTVIALREIAGGLVDADILNEVPEVEEEVVLEEEAGKEENMTVSAEGEDDAGGIDVAAAIKAALGGMAAAAEVESGEVAPEAGTSEGGE